MHADSPGDSSHSATLGLLLIRIQRLTVEAIALPIAPLTLVNLLQHLVRCARELVLRVLVRKVRLHLRQVKLGHARLLDGHAMSLSRVVHHLYLLTDG